MANPRSEIPKEYFEKFKLDEQAFEDATVQFGIIGVTGTGKSSLINAIAGKEIAEVGVVETTGLLSELSVYEFQNIILIDLPGVGTKNWETKTYFSDLMKFSPLEKKYSLRAEDFDCFILVLANRILEEDLDLYRLITRDLKKQCFLVRSKFDIDANNNYRTKNKSDKKTYQEIIKDVWKNFPREKKERVFVVSTVEPNRGDFEDLEEAIAQSLPDLKSEKFIAYAKAYHERFLKKKRAVAKHLAGRLALLSASNALNPIPVLGLAVDIGILLKLSHDLLEIYGLTGEQLKYGSQLNFKNEVWYSSFSRRTIEMSTTFLTREGIVRVLQSFAPILEVKEMAKWFPFAGQAIAAFLGYKVTSSFAEEVMTQYEAQTFEMIKKLEAS